MTSKDNKDNNKHTVDTRGHVQGHQTNEETIIAIISTLTVMSAERGTHLAILLSNETVPLVQEEAVVALNNEDIGIDRHKMIVMRQKL